MSLFTELRRRNVFKVAVAYAIVAWLLAQVIVVVETPLHLPGWMDTFIIVLLITGFPIALILTWAFELTPEGVKQSGKSDKQTDAETKGVTPTSVIDNTQQSIAVLPFTDMSPDKDQEYFSDGIAEEMLNHLAKIKGLYVAGRTSSFSFKGKDEDLRVIGGKLNVAHILEGSIRKAGNRIRITAQLIKAADGYHLWSESYDRELDDVFAIQEGIANAVTDALSITLGVGNFGVGSTRNIVAYDAYLAALSLINQGGREDAIQAIERLEQAVSLDPDFADAWSTLAAISYSTAQIYIPERAEEFLKKLEHATSRTIAIAPDTFVSYRATALLEYSGRNWSKAEQAYKKALELTPTDFWINALFGFFLQSVGRPQEAVEHCRRAVKCEPLTVNPAQILGVGYELNGELYSALVEYARGRELLGNQALLNGPRIAAALTKGDRAPIEAAFKEYMASSSDMLLSGHQDLNQTMFDHLDEPEEAISALHRFYQDPAYNNPFISSVIALWASYYGEHELALDIFQKFHASRSFLTYLIWRPIHKPIRQLPGFKDLVRNLGLVDYWRETGNWGQFCRPVGEDDFECI